VEAFFIPMKSIKKIYKLYLDCTAACTDTRSIEENSIFFALKGPNFNANTLAYKALENGASYAIVDEEKYVLDERYILVKDALDSLQQLAKHHRQQLKCPIIAITGTNGKTTSKELCLQVLKQKYKTTATKGNFNNQIGVPLSLLSIPLDTEIAIIEMGANHLDEIDFLCRLAEPDYGVITNVGKAHLEGFGSLEGVLKTKTELYRYLNEQEGFIFHKDNQQILIEQLPENCEHYSYGQLNSSTCRVEMLGAQPFVSVKVDNQTINSRLIGAYNYDNIALSIAMGLHFEVPIGDIKVTIENYNPQNNRSQIVEKENNTILLDAYNANPMSIEKAIENIQSIEHSNKVMILGDMFELGEESKKEHLNIINHCLSSGVNHVYLVGSEFHAVNATQFASFNTTNELALYIKKHPIKDAFVLIKGSRGMKLESLLEDL
jgi:UDP-N-acetylmuramoyl-tripeptide--D-alanyl-D-alanine ligase